MKQIQRKTMSETELHLVILYFSSLQNDKIDSKIRKLAPKLVCSQFRKDCEDVLAPKPNKLQDFIRSVANTENIALWVKEKSQRV